MAHPLAIRRDYFIGTRHHILGFGFTARTINIALGGYKFGFKQLLKDLKPFYYDMSDEEKDWFNYQASKFRKTTYGQRYISGRVISTHEFVQATFPTDKKKRKVVRKVAPLIVKLGFGQKTCSAPLRWRNV